MFICHYHFLWMSFSNGHLRVVCVLMKFTLCLSHILQIVFLVGSVSSEFIGFPFSFAVGSQIYWSFPWWLLGFLCLESTLFKIFFFSSMFMGFLFKYFIQNLLKCQRPLLFLTTAQDFISITDQLVLSVINVHNTHSFVPLLKRFLSPGSQGMLCPSCPSLQKLYSYQEQVKSHIL